MNEEYGQFIVHKHTFVFNDKFKIRGFEHLILENHQKTIGNILALEIVKVFKLERRFYSRRPEIIQLPVKVEILLVTCNNEPA
jgi:hypothetical protein